MPGFARIAGDPAAIRDAYANAIGMLAILAVPAATGIFASGAFYSAGSTRHQVARRGASHRNSRRQRRACCCFIPLFVPCSSLTIIRPRT